MADLCDMKQARGHSEIAEKPIGSRWLRPPLSLFSSVKSRALALAHKPKLQWTLETTEKLQTTESPPHSSARGFPAGPLATPASVCPSRLRVEAAQRSVAAVCAGCEGDRLSAVWRCVYGYTLQIRQGQCLCMYECMGDATGHA
ncbi:hypothetical protein MHYP_G00309180 [Metynnis hypsauchen]